MAASSHASLLKMWTDLPTKNLNHNTPEIIFFLSGPKYLEISRIPEISLLSVVYQTGIDIPPKT